MSQEILDAYIEKITSATYQAGVAGLARGTRGRVLFQAFLALATAEKQSPVTIQEITRLCAHETEVAFRLGLVK